MKIYGKIDPNSIVAMIKMAYKDDHKRLTAC